MVRPQILPLEWMRRFGPAFHLGVSCLAPASIVVKQAAVHKPYPRFLSAISRPFGIARIVAAICYYWGVRQGQTGKIAGEFVKHVVPAIAKPARALWNEVVGFIFICLGVTFGFTALRYIRRGETFQVVVSGIATFIMAYYGISSFLRARKISRS